jgi:hypothetical protein
MRARIVEAVAQHVRRPNEDSRQFRKSILRVGQRVRPGDREAVET